MFVRQFVIAVHKAGLLEISVVTFSNDNDGIIVFNADKSVDDVVAEMYTQFDDGRRAAEQQLDHSRMQSANAPNRNADWRLIKERDPPLEAFMSTSAPAGDPNSLLRANATLREPAAHDEIIRVPRTPPKAARVTPQDVQPTNTVVPKTPPKSPPVPKPPATPPPWRSYRPDNETPRSWISPPPLNQYGRWQWHYQNGWVWRPYYDHNVTNIYSPVYYPSDDEVWEWMERGWNDFTMRHGIVNL